MSSLNPQLRMWTLLFWGLSVAAGLWTCGLQNSNAALGVAAQEISRRAAELEELTRGIKLHNRVRSGEISGEARPSDIDPARWDRSNLDSD